MSYTWWRFRRLFPYAWINGCLLRSLPWRRLEPHFSRHYRRKQVEDFDTEGA